MKKYLKSLLVVVAILLTVATTAVAATVLLPSGGGTGNKAKPAKGTVLVGSSTISYGLLGVGANGRVLTASSTAPYGVSWETTAAGGITSMNGLSGATQTFATSGPALSITSSGTSHTWSLPTSTASVTGVLTGADWTIFNAKAPTASPTFTGTVSVPATNFTVGASTPFSDSAGTLTLTNVDALDATTESTVESAIDTLGNLTSASALATVGTITSGTWGATDVTVPNGGTGVSTLGDAGVLVGNGTGVVQVTAAGTSGQVLTSNGAGVDPTFQAATAGTPLTTYFTRMMGHSQGLTSATMNSNTTMRATLFNLPGSITVNSIVFDVTTVSVAGTLDFSLYTEDGQTRSISVTTANISGIGVQSVAVSSVTLPAGNYWLTTNSNTTADIALRTLALQPVLLVPTGEPPLTGTLTVTAGTPPTSFTPTSITSDSNALIVRLEN